MKPNKTFSKMVTSDVDFFVTHFGRWEHYITEKLTFSSSSSIREHL